MRVRACVSACKNFGLCACVCVCASWQMHEYEGVCIPFPGGAFNSLINDVMLWAVL